LYVDVFGFSLPPSCLAFQNAPAITQAANAKDSGYVLELGGT
jgi:hypothetical protein